MDVNTKDQRKEGIAFFTTNTHIFKMIVVQKTVVDALGGGSCFVDAFPFRSTSWDGSKNTDIPSGFSIDDPAIA